MILPILIFYILIGIVVPTLSFMILRTVLKKPPYKFKMIFRSPGVDTHFTVYGDALSFKHKIGDQEYEIKAERLYRFRPGIAQRILYKFRGIKESFFIVYLDKKTEPLAPGTAKVSARIIKEVSESRARDRALKSEF